MSENTDPENRALENTVSGKKVLGNMSLDKKQLKITMDSSLLSQLGEYFGAVVK